ncbi:MAG: type II toxin-antitoxin system RelE/ParE family toxin [Burkholderiales bacterium]|nr:type II toxin-antitoxin system RelE/ParE family toxin [Burkholderiales bacterium]
MALEVRIKPRAARQIEQAAVWWSEHRPAAPGAIRADLQGALRVLLLQPGIGSKVENARNHDVRRLYLARVRYFVYYRIQGQSLDVVAFWHESRQQGPDV